MINEFEPNSHKFKSEQNQTQDERKKVEKVIKGDVRVKKKNEISKFASAFISDDVGSVKSYILMDVIVPAFKKLVSDVITDGVNMLVWGEPRKGKSNSPSSKVSYRSYYDGGSSSRADYDNNRTRTGYSYDDIILRDRREAEDVLYRMSELIDTYGVVSVADLYDLVGVTGQYTDNKYGWTNISTAEVIRVRDGFLLKFPKVLPIS